MRLIRRLDQIDRPWKNGGGTTREILCYPEGASMVDFEWRISIARVAADGPFSHFPEVDRILTVIEGKGLDLRFGSGQAVTLTRASGPYAFDGGEACDASLCDGAISDLNVMCRRGLWRASVTLVEAPCRMRLDCVAGPIVVCVLSGAARIGTTMLDTADAALLPMNTGADRLEMPEAGTCAVIALERYEPQRGA